MIHSINIANPTTILVQLFSSLPSAKNLPDTIPIAIEQIAKNNVV